MKLNETTAICISEINARWGMKPSAWGDWPAPIQVKKEQRDDVTPNAETHRRSIALLNEMIGKSGDAISRCEAEGHPIDVDAPVNSCYCGTKRRRVIYPAKRGWR